MTPCSKDTIFVNLLKKGNFFFFFFVAHCLWTEEIFFISKCWINLGMLSNVNKVLTKTQNNISLPPFFLLCIILKGSFYITWRNRPKWGLVAQWLNTLFIILAKFPSIIEHRAKTRYAHINRKRNLTLLSLFLLWLTAASSIFGLISNKWGGFTSLSKGKSLYIKRLVFFNVYFLFIILIHFLLPVKN